MASKPDIYISDHVPIKITVVVIIVVNYLFYELEELVIKHIMPFRVDIFGLMYIIIGVIQFTIIVLLVLICINIFYNIKRTRYWKSWIKVPAEHNNFLFIVCSPVIFILLNVSLFLVKQKADLNYWFNYIIHNYTIIFIILVLLICLPYFLFGSYLVDLFLVAEKEEYEQK